jgi:hypothetical protein
MTEATKTNQHGFPIQTCTRCHGSGHHSYNQIHGTMCYGCGGGGVQIVKKAKPAWIAFVANAKSLKEIVARDLKVGQVACKSGAKIKKEIVGIEVLPTYSKPWSERHTAQAIADGYKPEQCFQIFAPMIVTFADGTTEETDATSVWKPVVTLADLNADFYLAQIPQRKVKK